MCSMQLSGGIHKMLKCTPYESTSEAVGDHHKYIAKMYGNWSVTQAIHHVVVSRSSFPSEYAFVFEAPPKSLGSYRFECFLFAEHQTVIHIEMCTASE